MEFTEYELYETYRSSVEVPTRDVQKIDFVALFKNDIPPTVLGFPIEFRFYDADVSPDTGREIAGTRRNVSKDYQVADIVMTLEDYKKRELPKLVEYKKQQRGRLEAFTSEFMDNGLSLRRAFKAALSPKRPVLDWHITAVEAAIAEAEKTGATHIALRDKHELASPVLVTANTVVLDQKLNQLHPAAEKPAAQRPAPSPAG